MSHPAKRIEETFPGACTKVAEWRGDVAVTVNRASLHDVAQFLRDDPALRFDYIVHVSSVLGRLSIPMAATKPMIRST